MRLAAAEGKKAKLRSPPPATTGDAFNHELAPSRRAAFLETIMIQLITASCYGDFARARCYARYRVFKERLGWDVQISGDLEVDEFDSSVLHISFKSRAM
jgi:hypothetical protein